MKDGYSTDDTPTELRADGGRPVTYSDESMLKVLYDCFPEPVTIKEVASELGASKATVHDRLHEMTEAGTLKTKKTGSGGRVFWINPEQYADNDEYPDPPEWEKPKSYYDEADGTDVRKNFDHSEKGDYKTRYSEEDILAVIREAWPEPLTQKEIAERAGCSKSLLRNKLPPLEGANVLQSKKPSSRSRVYWTETPDVTFSDDDD